MKTKKFIIHTVYIAVRDDGSWDMAGHTIFTDNLEDAKKTVRFNRQRSNVLATAWTPYTAPINNKEDHK